MFSRIYEVSEMIGANIFRVIRKEKVQEICKDSKIVHDVNGVQNKKPTKNNNHSLCNYQLTCAKITTLGSQEQQHSQLS